MATDADHAGEREPSGLKRMTFNATPAAQAALGALEAELGTKNSTDAICAAAVLGGMVARLVAAGAVITAHLPDDSEVFLSLPGMEYKGVENLLAQRGNPDA